VVVSETLDGVEDEELAVVELRWTGTLGISVVSDSVRAIFGLGCTGGGTLSALGMKVLLVVVVVPVVSASLDLFLMGFFFVASIVF
jgi:hypothetical protein